MKIGSALAGLGAFGLGMWLGSRPIGTKSILFGAHQFVLHPAFMFFAWKRQYGWYPTEPPALLMLAVHDLGYWGLDEMDGKEGIYHPLYGAAILDSIYTNSAPERYQIDGERRRWADICALHSRSLADILEQKPSKLMAVDKCATAMYPHWLYWLLCSLSGEWREYKERWIESGTYPGRPDDNCWEWSGHLLKEWERFLKPNASAGRSFVALMKGGSQA